MREIKFKIWDKEQKKILDINWEDEETRFNKGKAILRYSTEHGLYATLSGYRDADGWPYEIDSEIMQYTGLKDKDGQEIYEGDIVRCYGGEYCQGCWEQDHTITIKNMLNDCFMMGEFENLKVIGNIFENEDLLNGQQ